LLSAAVGLFTPILSIKGIAFRGDGVSMWTATMPFFNLDIPYAVLTPLAQSALAALALLFMTRRLRQPLLTSLSKLQSYAVLLILDLIWAALQFDALKLGEGLTAPAVRFAIGHTILVMLMVGRTTPGRESYLSWVWRLRGRRSLLVELLLGERSLNVLTLPVYCLIGAAVFLGAIALPVCVWQPQLLAVTNWDELVIGVAVSLLVILCYGLFYQVLSVAMGRGAGVTLFVIAVAAMVGPYALGAGYDLPLVASVSPLATFVRLQDQTLEPYAPAPILLVHAAGIAFWAWGLRGMARRLTRQADCRLDSMGIRAAAAVPSG
jgi:hypothetical protein